MKGTVGKNVDITVEKLREKIWENIKGSAVQNYHGMRIMIAHPNVQRTT